MGMRTGNRTPRVAPNQERRCVIPIPSLFSHAIPLDRFLFGRFQNQDAYNKANLPFASLENHDHYHSSLFAAIFLLCKEGGRGRF